MMNQPGRLAQPIRTRPLHKLLHKKLRIPQRFVQPILSAAKMAGHSDQVRLRRELAAQLVANGRPATAPAADTGFRIFAPGELPGACDAAARCAEIFEKHRSTMIPDEEAIARRRHLVGVLKGARLLEHPELIRFALSRPILDAAIAYLGTVPLAAGAALLWSPVNESAHSSQLYHLDDEDRTQLKLFVNVTETGDEHGPLTFLPAPASRRLGNALGLPIGRVADEHVAAKGVSDSAIRLVGAPGSAAFVDTSRCLHYGSRSNTRERLVLQLQFLRFQAPGESTSRFEVSPHFLDLDPLQRLALGLS